MKASVNLEDLTATVEKHSPHLVADVVNDRDVVNLDASDAPLTVEATFLFGAIVQVICKSGGRVLLYNPDTISDLKW